MDRSEGDDHEGPSQQQNTMWKQFQAKAKPLLSPKLGSREPDDKKERGLRMFKRIKWKQNVSLDRVISSSQPDLLFSSQVDPDPKEAQLCDKPAGSGLGRDRQHQPHFKHKTSSPNKPTVAQLVQSHHKSSSLGSACLERLVDPPGSHGGGEEEEEAAGATSGAAEEQLESRDDLFK
uniref:Uncharacterized protein n=1 Tax=Sphaeramia orbicularis TaxID=375764 RepID=A0A673ABE7_9TELE